MPRPDEMVQIKTATKGIVSADDFLPAPKSTVAA